MAEAKTIIGRVKTRKDSYNNWKIYDPNLLEGELVIATGNTMNTLNGMSMLVFGDGKKSFTDIVAGEKIGEHHPTSRSTNNAVFYSGIGAGYQLPVATTTDLGGIKINTNYFELDNNDRLQPVLYKIGGTEDFPTIEFDKRYRGVFNELEWVKSYDSIGFTLILNDVKGEDEQKELQPMGYDNPYAGTVVQYYKRDGLRKLNSFMGIDENGVPLVSKDYLFVDNGSGYNYSKMKQIATLDLNANQGVVHYNGLDNFSTVPVYPMQFELFVDGHLQREISYDPFSPENDLISVNTVEEYCTNITVNGNNYTLDNTNHCINLGDAIWTNAERDKLNTTYDATRTLRTDLDNAIKIIPNKIIFNGKDYPLNADKSFVIEENYTNLVPITSDDGSISIIAGGEGYHLSHYQPHMEISTIKNEIVVSKNKPQIIGIEDLEFDNLGHISKMKLNSYDLSNIIVEVEKISDLVTKTNQNSDELLTLQTKNNELTNQVNDLEDEVSTYIGVVEELRGKNEGLTARVHELNSLVEELVGRIEALENNNTESE